MKSDCDYPKHMDFRPTDGEWIVGQDADYCPETGVFEGVAFDGTVFVMKEVKRATGPGEADFVVDYEPQIIAEGIGREEDAYLIAAAPRLLEANNAAALAIYRLLEDHFGAEPECYSRDALIKQVRAIRFIMKQVLHVLDAVNPEDDWDKKRAARINATAAAR